MPLTVFEAYFFYGIDNGYPQDHWDTVVEQYEELTDERGRGTAKETILRHTELASKYNAWSGLLDTVTLLAYSNMYAPALCATLRSRFTGLQFSKESILEDIPIARSKLKTLEGQISDLEAQLPKEQKQDTTFFDRIMQTYGQVFQAPMEAKHLMTVQQFALHYAALKKQIQQDNISKHGR